MKSVFFIFTLMSLESCSNFNKVYTPNESRQVASERKVASEKVKSSSIVLASTKGKNNISAKGFNYPTEELTCKIVLLNYVDPKDGEEHQDVYLDIGRIGDKDISYDVDLFSIDKNDQYFRENLRVGNERLKANNLTQEQLDNGYVLDSNDTGITYSNGRPCSDTGRNKFNLRYKNENLKEIESIKIQQGVCGLAGAFISTMDTIFPSDYRKIELKCDFSKKEE